MTATVIEGARRGAIERSSRHSPFLREAMAHWPAITEIFRNQGGETAVDEGPLAVDVADADNAVIVEKAQGNRSGGREWGGRG